MMSGFCPANGDGLPVAAQPGSGESSAEGAPKNTTTSGRAKAPKVFPCPHPGCGKQYKQMSGLRYHLSHVRVCPEPSSGDIRILTVFLLSPLVCTGSS